MYNYYTDQVIAIDIGLLITSVLLSASIILYIFLRDHSEKRYKHRLWEIKKNLYALASAGTKLTTRTCLSFAGDAIPRDLLDVEMNRARDAVFFNATEQAVFRECFAASLDKIRQAEKYALDGRDKWQRIEAILSLGYLEEKTALDILKKTIFDRDEDVSYFTMMSLGHIMTDDSAAILLDLFRKNKTARHKVVSVLGEFPPGVIKEVAPLTKERDPDARFWALKLLAKLGCAGHVKDVEKLTVDPVNEVRAAACECLGKSGEKSSASYIESCLHDDSWLVRASCVKALSDLQKGAAMEKIVPLVNDSSLSVIKSVRDAMAANIESALPYVNNILQGNDALAKKISIEAIEISGYMEKFLRNLLGPESAGKRANRAILEGIVRSHIHDGLIGAISIFRGDERIKLLNEIRGIDEMLAKEIENKI